MSAARRPAFTPYGVPVPHTLASTARNAPRRSDERMSAAALGELLRSRPAWAVFALLWIFHAVAFVASTMVIARGEDLREIVWVGVTDTLSWLGVQLAAFAVVWAVPLEPRRPLRAAAVLLASGVAVLTFRLWFLDTFGNGFPDPLPLLLVRMLPMHLLAFFTDAGVGYAVAWFFRRRDREVAARRAEARLSQARLQVLKMQIHPHFLFNTLNSVSALMHRDPEEAVRTLERLRQLLERTQAQAGVQEVPLREELEFLSLYLEIERTRLGERLKVRTRVERGLEEARVPHLALQLLVENSIRHGIAPRRGPGEVEISAARRGDRLVLRVTDDGKGLPPEGLARRGGVGVANTRARLAQLYGRDHHFEVRPRPEGGVAATIEIPLDVPADAVEAR